MLPKFPAAKHQYKHLKPTPATPTGTLNHACPQLCHLTSTINPTVLGGRDRSRDGAQRPVFLHEAAEGDKGKIIWTQLSSLGSGHYMFLGHCHHSPARAALFMIVECTIISLTATHHSSSLGQRGAKYNNDHLISLCLQPLRWKMATTMFSTVLPERYFSRTWRWRKFSSACFPFPPQTHFERRPDSENLKHLFKLPWELDPDASNTTKGDIAPSGARAHPARMTKCKCDN